ncbi:hypothetical protein G7Z17_g4106 [Cylindrodendrum hubeiense]|uniref:Pre-mRNA-processing factor 19 n=1 Tax=Cylindrodendrum hubeiense TaxID=595255 RepID=A0A9P5HJQ3_9HYPO|nr:hypothetical protein G7Z17_g4106 [Cylindrodendrum hubeiense]
MLCGISGEAPQEPVVSKKSGVVYEKRLIEQYISEHGTEPSSGEGLTSDDLLPIHSSRIVRPRPPTLTSIPALLATFQNEWDALALETYNLKEQLARTREELATALYQHDAAIRVIARLTRERDEARDALSKVTVSGGSGGDQMVVDSVEQLPEELAARVDATHQTLSKGRKKRPIPEGWVSTEEVSSFAVEASNALPVPQATSLGLEGDYAAVGGVTGEAVIYSVGADKVERQVPVNEPVTDTLWTGSKLIFATGQGSVKVFEGGNELASLSEHSGAVTALSVHPGGELLASVGTDKSIVFYDLASLSRASRAYTDAALTSCAFHPDGHLFAAGTVSGDIKLFMTKTLEQAAVFKLGAPVQALAFSENGFWFAATAKGQTMVTIFDLRKEGDAAVAKVLETGGPVQSLAWDYSSQFLATGGASGVTVHQYTKSSKAWSEPLRSATPAIAVRWGESGKKLVTVNGDGVTGLGDGIQRERRRSAVLVGFHSSRLAHLDFCLLCHSQPSSPPPRISSTRLATLLIFDDNDDDTGSTPSPTSRRHLCPAANDIPDRAPSHRRRWQHQRQRCLERNSRGARRREPSTPPGCLETAGAHPRRRYLGAFILGLVSHPHHATCSSPRPHLARSMATHREDSLFVSDSDPIQIDSSPNRLANNGINLILPMPEGWSNGGTPNTSQPSRSTRRTAAQQPPQPAPVIDLTEEPDSPVQARRSLSHNHGGRNPRRTNSQRASPPRLARRIPGDDLYENPDHPSYDPSHPLRRRLGGRLRPRPDELIELEFISSVPRRAALPTFAIGLTRRLAGILGSDIIGGAFNQPQLDVSRSAFAPPREPSPKPPMEPAPPTREGFTRDTCADPEKESETIVICPACNEELAYDPNGVVAPSPTSGKKRKRAPGEHHFWALKKCGHVYCADCFENRKPTKANPDGAGFRVPEGKSLNEIRCVVDGCDTKVSAKGEWVGIFL